MTEEELKNTRQREREREREREMQIKIATRIVLLKNFRF